MSDSAIRDWCSKCREGRTNVRHSTVTDEKGGANYAYQLSDFYMGLLTAKIYFLKYCARWIPKRLTDHHTNNDFCSSR